MVCGAGLVMKGVFVELYVFFFQAEDGIRDLTVTGVQTCALPISAAEPVRVIVFGAHPDDAELKAGGSAAKWAKLGHKVKMVSVTNGDIGHWRMAGDRKSVV